MKFLAVAGLLFVVPASLVAQFRIPIPRVPGVSGVELPIPGIEDLVEEEPTISTNLLDAQTEIALLDDYTPQEAISMLTMPRGDRGSFILEPGAYEFEAQSYCLRAGTHSPGSGNGYLYAPLKGQREEIIRHILENSVDHPDIPQNQIQVLIWGIIARTKLNDMPDDIQAAANRLLTERERRALNGGALGLIPDGVRRELFAQLPADVRQVFEAEAEIRSLLTEGTPSFDQLERIAVLTGDPEQGEGSRDVPSGRWSYHPDGYFVRYFPSGYRQTRIEVSVPEPMSIERDTLGRITAIADADGNRIETQYDDSVSPLTVPGDPSLVGYAFQSVRFVQVDPAQSSPQEMEWLGTGWTWVEQDAISSAPSSALVASENWLVKALEEPFQLISPHIPMLAQGGDRFSEWQQRYETAQEWRERVGYYQERWEERTGDRSADDVEDVTDLGHYRDGIETATQGSQGDRLDWIIRHHERTANALEYAICVLEGGCSDAGNSVEFNPADDVATPANTARQRLGQSARPYGN
jgi:hypothetical protein